MSVDHSLLVLPSELLVEIFKYLELRELRRCTQVCNLLQSIIKGSLELQYHIELAADNLVDGIGCSLSTAERLALLLQRRARWRYLNWTRVTQVTVPELCQSYELVDGVFASSMAVDWAGRGSPHLSLTWLPTSTHPAGQLERVDIGVIMRDFAIDPSQDLIGLVVSDAIASFTVHLRTISENKPHPLAIKSELFTPVPFHVGNSCIQIVDDVIGAFFWVHGPGLIIWNWKTGKTVVNRIGIDLPSGTYDFGFLSSRAFLITATTGYGSVELYTFSGDDDSPPPATRDQSQSPSSAVLPSLPTQVAVLHLPPTQLGKGLRRFTTHSSPFVAHQGGRPFERSRDSRLHVMSLDYGDRSGDFNMFMHNRYLLSFVPPGVRSGEKVTPIIKDWDDWGPDHTRFIPFTAPFQWLRYTHGGRVVFPPVLHDLSRGVMKMYMLDFNVHPKRLDDPVSGAGDTERSSDGDATYEVVAQESVIDSGVVFQSPVVSKLPYSISTKKGLPALLDYSGFMIDDERLVAMKAGESNSEYGDIDIYTF